MAEDLVLPVPPALSATYAVPTGLERDDAQARLMAALETRVADPLATVVRELFDEGAARVVGMQAEPLPAFLQQYLGVPDELVHQVNSADKLLAVVATLTPDSLPMHELAARAGAAALADDLGVPLVDAFLPKVLTAGKALASLPGDPSLLNLSEWVHVFQSPGDHGLWTTTKGMGRFGLPELQSFNVGPQDSRPWARLVTGLASRLLALWAGALADQDSPFARIPAVLEVGESDVAAAYRTEAAGGGSVQVRLTFDPATDDETDSFLTIQPPDSYRGPAGEYFANACVRLFGSAGQDIRYLTRTDALDRAIEKARQTLASARTRFLEHDFPPHARLTIKYRLQTPAGTEYPWADVNSWRDPAKALCSSASDALYDPAVRVGSPVVIDADTIVDWGIWTDAEGIIEGAFTNAVALGQPETGDPEHGSLSSRG